MTKHVITKNQTLTSKLEVPTFGNEIVLWFRNLMPGRGHDFISHLMANMSTSYLIAQLTKSSNKVNEVMIAQDLFLVRCFQCILSPSARSYNPYEHSKVCCTVLFTSPILHSNNYHFKQFNVCLILKADVFSMKMERFSVLQILAAHFHYPEN